MALTIERPTKESAAARVAGLRPHLEGGGLTSRLNVDIPAAEMRRLKVAAAERGVTVASLVRSALANIE